MIAGDLKVSTGDHWRLEGEIVGDLKVSIGDLWRLE